MWFRNLVVYRVPARWDLSSERLAEMLAPQAFVPGSAIDEVVTGWAPPIADDESLVATVHGQHLLSLRQEKKLLPARVISQFVRQRIEKIEQTEGYKPGRKQAKEIKEEVRDELLPRAFSLASDTAVWIDPRNGWLAIDTGSAGRAEEIFSLLARAIEKFPARPLKLPRPIAEVLTEWLLAGDAPDGFTIDQDAALSARQGKASIRYANDDLPAEEVARHIEAGKLCTRLAMTWADRISFVLTDKFEIKRIKPLEILSDESGQAEGDDARARFEADAMLMTRELAALLDALVQACGGEQIAQAA
ncbi:MAG: recombination-associated protein RdgC [Burkholderiaceae bacterium]